MKEDRVDPRSKPREVVLSPEAASSESWPAVLCHTICSLLSVERKLGLRVSLEKNACCPSTTVDEVEDGKLRQVNMAFRVSSTTYGAATGQLVESTRSWKKAKNKKTMAAKDA